MRLVSSTAASTLRLWYTVHGEEEGGREAGQHAARLAPGLGFALAAEVRVLDSANQAFRSGDVARARALLTGLASGSAVKVSTSYSGGLKFDIAALPVHPEMSAERGTEQDVYFPKISVSGIDFGYAMWDFTAVGEEPLKVDRPLRLLAAVPASGSDIPVQLTLRALVTARGAVGRIPLIGRQNTTIPLKTNA